MSEWWNLTSPSVDGSWTKGFPHNGFTDIGGNEEGYPEIINNIRNNTCLHCAITLLRHNNNNLKWI